MRRVVLSLLILVAALLPGLAAAQPVQRMLVAPGCYTLAPGQSADVTAYCLDQKLRAPPQGAILSEAPSALGKAVVYRGKAMTPLLAAMSEGALRIEGVGEYSQIRLRNISSEPLTVCFMEPTVVMAVDGAPGALKSAYERLKALVAESRPETPASPDLEQRAETQRQIWDLVNAAEASDAASVDRRVPIQLGTLAPPPPKPAPKPGRRDCVGAPNTGVVCLER
jgi:hypothetical protein